MSASQKPARFAVRPGNPDAWVKASEPPPARAEQYDARLTVDVTTTLRGQIKVAAFRRGLTVADMLRALLAREFGDDAASS